MGLLLAVALIAKPAPAILPSDPRIAYVGRFDRSDETGYGCQWSASEVRLRLKGASLTATFEDEGRNYWQVVVDGKPTQVLPLKAGLNDYTVSLGSDAVHDVSLVKRTEAFLGISTFRGLTIPGGGLFQAKRRSKLIEFVGDSITCAFGNEGANEKEQFKPETENAYLSYASIAARTLSADVRIVAWSGRKMWPDNTVPEIYDRILPTKETPKVDFAVDAPDAVVINLATNDFAPDNPEEKGWTSGYEAFIRRVWGVYPKTHVYVAIGSMMTDDYPVGHQALSTLRGYLNRMVGRIHDPRLHLVEFDQQKMEDGIGSAWHPNLVTHRKMADRLVSALQKDLKW